MMTCRSARNAVTTEAICVSGKWRMHPLSRHHHFKFEWDRKTGYSHDMVCYGPFDCSSSIWIVPGTIEESEYDIEREEDDDSGQVW